MNKLYSIKKLMGSYDVAMRSGSNEIRLNTADVGLIVSDINKLLALNVVEDKLNVVSEPSPVISSYVTVVDPYTTSLIHALPLYFNTSPLAALDIVVSVNADTVDVRVTASLIHALPLYRKN